VRAKSKEPVAPLVPALLAVAPLTPLRR